MFISKKTVIYITRNKIWAGNFSRPNPQLLEFTWDGTEASAAFLKIKKTLRTSKVKIVLGEDLGYVLTLELSPENTNRKFILQAASSLVPEDLSDHDFDWMTVQSSPKNNLNFVQVVAIKPAILRAISSAVNQNGLKVKSIKAVSIILAKATADLQKPQLILWAVQEAIAVVAYRGRVYFSENISTHADQKVAALTHFAREKFGLDLKLAVVDWQPGLHGLTGLDKVPSVPAKWNQEERDLNPMAQAAQDKPKKTKDEEALEVELTEKLAKHLTAADSPESKPKETTPSPEPATETSASKPEVEVAKPIVKPAKIEPVTKTDQPPTEKKMSRLEANKKLVLLVVGALVFGSVIIGGWRFLGSRSAKESEVEKLPATSDEEVQVETPVEAEEMTEAGETETGEEVEASPSAEINLTDYTLQILNGSGVAGEAGRVVEILTTEGFENLTTGNADSYDYTDTEVARKEDILDEVLELVKEALTDYSVVEGNFLDEESDFDLVIIVGERES